MPRKRRRNGRKSKFVTKRSLPFQMMKYVEQKFIVLAIADLLLPVPATTANLIHLTAITQGNDQFSRDGNMIQVTGIYAKVTFTAVSSAKIRFFRLIIYSPRIANDINSPVSRVVGLPDPDEFVIWVDKLVPCPLPAAATPGGVMMVKKKFKPYMKVLYDDATGGSVKKSAIRIALIGSENEAVNVSLELRLYFKDL